jgi:hypothetical protein
MSNRRPDASYNLCTFQFANGKCCGMPAHPQHNGLCLNHATVHRRTFHREDDLLNELASPAGDFITQIDINHVLGKLFDALAANRISPRRAATLAYIGHLLMLSQKGAKNEAKSWEIDSSIFCRLAEIKSPGTKHPKAISPRTKPTEAALAPISHPDPKTPPTS